MNDQKSFVAVSIKNLMEKSTNEALFPLELKKCINLAIYKLLLLLYICFLWPVNTLYSTVSHCYSHSCFFFLSGRLKLGLISPEDCKIFDESGSVKLTTTNVWQSIIKAVYLLLGHNGICCRIHCHICCTGIFRRWVPCIYLWIRLLLGIVQRHFAVNTVSQELEFVGEEVKKEKEKAFYTDERSLYEELIQEDNKETKFIGTYLWVHKDTWRHPQIFSGFKDQLRAANLIGAKYFICWLFIIFVCAICGFF